MNTFFEKYKALIDFVENLFNTIIQNQSSPIQIVGRIIITFLIVVATLVFLSLAGLLQDPTGLIVPLH